MFGRSCKEYFELAKFGLVIILIITAGRWIVSLSGVPYYPRGTAIFSIVLATTFLALAYGGFMRRGYGLSLLQSIVVVAMIAIFAQLLILISTAVSYMGGMETYFNYADALNAEMTPTFGEAMGARVGGLIVNTITAIIECALGYWIGGLLPVPKKSGPATHL